MSEDVVRGAAGMPEPPVAQAAGDVSVEDLEEAMRDVVDPELGINVVDLGLIYGIQATDGVAVIDMTLTSAACPLTDVIEDQARAALTKADPAASSTTSRSTGSGCRRGGPRRSPRTAASSCGRWASASSRGPSVHGCRVAGGR